MSEIEAPGGLGRLYVPDTRDHAFPMTSVLPHKAPLRTKRYWFADGWWGDQRMTSQCVAYAWTAYLEDGPVTHAKRRPSRTAQHGRGDAMIDPAWLYGEAQKVDQWPGENYDGTSVRAGAKILQDAGHIGEYRWAEDVDTIVTAILTKGPVVVGTLWTAGMSQPDDDHVVRPTGAKQGGHAYLLNGVNTRREAFRIKNSWGREWGHKGHAWISFSDFAGLLAQQGEACLAVERHDD